MYIIIQNPNLSYPKLRGPGETYLFPSRAFTLPLVPPFLEAAFFSSSLLMMLRGVVYSPLVLHLLEQLVDRQTTTTGPPVHLHQLPLVAVLAEESLQHCYALVRPRRQGALRQCLRPLLRSQRRRQRTTRRRTKRQLKKAEPSRR